MTKHGEAFTKQNKEQIEGLLVSACRWAVQPTLWL